MSGTNTKAQADRCDAQQFINIITRSLSDPFHFPFLKRERNMTGNSLPVRSDYWGVIHLPACTIKPLQLIQNAAARVVFNEPKKAHVTPLFIRLHWLPIAARIKFKVLMFAYKTTTGTAPIYLNSLVQTYAPSRSLRSASERRLVVPSQRGTKSLSRTFTWTVSSWWNDLPISIRTAESLAIFKKHLKTHLFRQHLTN